MKKQFQTKYNKYYVYPGYNFVESLFHETMQQYARFNGTKQLFI